MCTILYKCCTILHKCCTILYKCCTILYKCCTILYKCCTILFKCCTILYKCCTILFKCCTILYKCCTLLYKCWYISGLYEEEGLYCYVRYVLIFHKTSMLYNNVLHCGNLLYVLYWSMLCRILYVKGYNIMIGYNDNDIQRLTHL